VAVSDPPAASALISQDLALSTETSINVYWTTVTSGTSPGGTITGYVLTIQECSNGTTWVVFNGTELGMPS
jgi:hypothetical protein